jgi:hypothetical protein
MIYKTLHRKQMIKQQVYAYPRENEVAILCEFRNLKRPKSETAAEYGHCLRILAQKVFNHIGISLPTLD